MRLSKKKKKTLENILISLTAKHYEKQMCNVNTIIPDNLYGFKKCIVNFHIFWVVP